MTRDEARVLRCGDVVWVVDDADGEVSVQAHTVVRVWATMVVFGLPGGRTFSRGVANVYPTEHAAWVSLIEKRNAEMREMIAALRGGR